MEVLYHIVLVMYFLVRELRKHVYHFLEKWNGFVLEQDCRDKVPGQPTFMMTCMGWWSPFCPQVPNSIAYCQFLFLKS